MTARLLRGLDRRRPHLARPPPRRARPLPDAGPELIAEVERAGLRGRGGAGFPAAIKLAAVAAGPRPVVVVNGTEGEPMSAKDRTLLDSRAAPGARRRESAARRGRRREVIIAAPARSRTPTLCRRARRARAAEPARLRVTLAASAAGYVAGEETAVLAHLEGRPPRPRVTPPLPVRARATGGARRSSRTSRRSPTSALIARHGAAWFREAGHAPSAPARRS